MGSPKTAFLPCLAFLLLFSVCAVGKDSDSKSVPLPSQGSATPQLSVPPPSASSFDQVIDKVVEREHFFTAQMRHLHPLVETYIQNLKSDKELGMVPASDQYF